MLVLICKEEILSLIHISYEKGADIYDKIFNDLDEAIVILKERKPSQTELEKIEDSNGKNLSLIHIFLQYNGILI